MKQENDTYTRPPMDFVERIKQLLDHLYDFSYLQDHPLVTAGTTGSEPTRALGGEILRRELISAIQTLSPGPDTPFLAPHARIHNLLQLRYVEVMSVGEAGSEVAISRRQAYRDLNRAVQSLAAVLWSRGMRLPERAETADRLDKVAAEISHATVNPDPKNLGDLLSGAIKAVTPLAVQRAVRFDVTMPAEQVVAVAEPMVARQILVNSLSQIVAQTAPGSTVRIGLVCEQQPCSMTLTYSLAHNRARDAGIDKIISQLVQRVGWTISETKNIDSSHVLSLGIRTGPPARLLIIDDNPAFAALLEDYVSGLDFVVHATTDSQTGLCLARELQPIAIVLDVMMPDIDGWEVLQRLYHQRKTRDIPIVVCSVIENPELAYSLGASLFLSKPVSRGDFRSALFELGLIRYDKNVDEAACR